MNNITINQKQKSVELRDSLNTVISKLFFMSEFSLVLSQCNDLPEQSITGFYTILNECIDLLEVVEKKLS